MSGHFVYGDTQFVTGYGRPRDLDGAPLGACPNPYEEDVETVTALILPAAPAPKQVPLWLWAAGGFLLWKFLK